MRGGAVVAGFVLSMAMGCTSTVRIFPAELRSIEPERVEAERAWPEVTTLDGQRRRLLGPLERVVLEHAEGPVPVHLPFRAELQGDELFVRDPLGTRAFLRSEVGAVRVDYENRKLPRTIAGASLLTVGAPLLGVGVYALVRDQTDASSGLATGIVGLIATGIGLIICAPGLYLALSDPAPPGQAERKTVRAAVRPRPGGGSLSVEF